METKTASVYLQVLVVISVVLSAAKVAAQTEEDLKRPYKFGFNIENMQHRQEMKDERGIITGEYGFITADGWYLTTIYATDEEGRFKILGRKRERVGPPLDPYTPITTARPTPPPARQVTTPAPRPVITISSPRPFQQVTSAPQRPSTLAPQPYVTTKPTPKPGPFKGIAGCGSCIIPTTTPRPTLGGFGSQSTASPGLGGFNRPGGAGLGGGSPAVGNVGTGGYRPTTGQTGFTSKPGRPQVGGGAGPQGGTGQGYGQQGGSGGGVGGTRPGAQGGVQGGQRPGAQGGVQGGQRPGQGGANNGQGQYPGSVQGGNSGGGGGGPQYKFNYTVGYHGHHETGYRDGSKTGDYFVNSRDGTGQKVVYEANEFGYQPNITLVDLAAYDTPREETEKEAGLKGYEFVWYNKKR